MEMLYDWFQRRNTRSTVRETTIRMPAPHRGKVSGVLACLASEGDGATPPTSATVMFTAACVLLVLPSLKRTCGRRFFVRLGQLLNISVTLSFLAVILIVTTAIQANDLFCFMANGRLSFIRNVDERWEPLIAVILMSLLALVNLACARCVGDWIARVTVFFKDVCKQNKVKCRRSPSRMVHRSRSTSRHVRFCDVKTTRRGTVYG